GAWRGGGGGGPSRGRPSHRRAGRAERSGPTAKPSEPRVSVVMCPLRPRVATKTHSLVQQQRGGAVAVVSTHAERRRGPGTHRGGPAPASGRVGWARRGVRAGAGRDGCQPAGAAAVRQL